MTKCYFIKLHCVDTTFTVTSSAVTIYQYLLYVTLVCIHVCVSTIDLGVVCHNPHLVSKYQNKICDWHLIKMFIANYVWSLHYMIISHSKSHMRILNDTFSEGACNILYSFVYKHNSPECSSKNWRLPHLGNQREWSNNYPLDLSMTFSM